MIALTLMVSVKTVLSNHLYCFHNQLYRQLKGGPIGENITNVLAEMVMYEFVNGYKTALFKPGIGWTGKSWNGHSLTVQEKTEIIEDSENELKTEHSLEDREKASAAVYRQIANTVLPRSIRMVEDTPHHHISGFLPILDMEIM